MIAFIKTLLLIVLIISSVVTVLFTIFGVYELIMGPEKSEKLLKQLHIPLSYSQVLIIGFACVVLIIICFLLRAKLSGKI